jgi:hypothetical protein
MHAVARGPEGLSDSSSAGWLYVQLLRVYPPI